MGRTDRFRRAVAALAGAALLLGSMAAGAALLDPPEGGYKEDATPPPPAFNLDKLIPIPMPVTAATLTLWMDPATLTLGQDSVVRYVYVVRSPSGNYSAIYEGIRCATGEVKVYARHFTDGGWRPVAEPKWQSLFDQVVGRYSMPIAKAGVCRDAAPNGSVRRILMDLRGGDNTQIDRRP